MQKPVPADPLWTAKQDSITLPKHVGLPGLRHSIGLARWWHLGIDVLWLANGLVFYVLLFASGEWRRLVPTSWQVFPDAASVLIQYLSLDWPADNGWAAYNGLQILAYFITVFVAAPLALVTGLGMSPALSTRFKRVSRLLSIQVARSLHFLVLCWFLFFIVIHVTLVFTTGLLRNLNHIYAGTRQRAAGSGFWMFAASMVVGHRRVVRGDAVHAASSARGAARRLRADRPGAAAVRARRREAGRVHARRTSRRTSGTTARTPTSDEYRALFDGGFADYRLRIARPRRATPSSCRSPSCARCRTTSRSRSTSASRAGRASRSGAAFDADDPRSGQADSRRRSGSCSIRSATGRTRGSTTTRTRSSRCATS